MGIDLRNFRGEIHRMGERILPIGYGVLVSNVKLFSHELRPWYQPLLVVEASKADDGDILSIYRLSDGSTDFWLNWLTDVDVVRSPIPGDDTQRIYWTGDGEPRESNLAIATTSSDYPSGWYVLGVIQPDNAPSVTPSGGSATDVSRVYQYTMVTAWGEEGMPSDPTSATGHPDGTWTIGSLETTVPNSGTISAAIAGADYVDVTFDTVAYLRIGEYVTIAAVTGMTDINGTWKIVSFPTGTDVRISVTTAQSYSAGGTWARQAPHHTTGMFKRVYRQDAVGIYRLVADNVALATASIVDGMSDADLALQTQLESEFYAMPPVDLFALTLGWNGMVFGLSKNTLYVCEPYKPHAWPSTNTYPMPWTGVALGVAGNQMLVIATQGNPYVALGTFSDSLSVDSVPLFEPCINKRSMVSFMFGAMYASNNGMILIGPLGAVIATEKIATHDEWIQHDPAKLIAANWQQRLLAFLPEPVTGLDETQIGGIFFDRTEGQDDFCDFSDLFVCTEAWTDPQTGKLYVVKAGSIYEWDSDTLNSVPLDWKSGIYQQRKPINMGVAKVDARYELLADTAQQAAQQAADLAYNAAINALSETWPGQGKTGGCVNEWMVNDMRVNGSLLRGGNYVFVPRYLTFMLYGSDFNDVPQLRFSKSLTNNRAFRCPAGYLAGEYQVRITGNIPAIRVRVAETMIELDRMA